MLPTEDDLIELDENALKAMDEYELRKVIERVGLLCDDKPSAEVLRLRLERATVK